MKVTLPIDWKRQLGQISQLIDGCGGIAFVRAGEFAAGNTFLTSVRNEMRQRGSITIQLNPEDPRSRTPEDILGLLLGKLEVRLPQGTEVTVASDIHAGRSVTQSNFNITNIFGSPSSYSSRSFDVTPKRVADSIAEMLPKKRIVLFVFNIHLYPESTISWFWQDFWADHMRNLIDAGLLVFILTIPGEKSGFPPDISHEFLTVDLPDLYEGVTLEQAIGDLAQIFLNRGAAADENDALSRAKMYLASTGFRPSLTHNGLPGTITSLLLVDGQH